MKYVSLVLLLCLEASPARTAPATTTTQTNSSIQHGSVSYHAYKTAIARNLPQGREEYYVYTPPNYDPKSSTNYPVLYLLHGFDQNARGWQTFGNAQLILDQLISEGKARPMIVVMPCGYGDYKFLRAGKLVWLLPTRINENDSLFSRMLLEEIIPRVESEYMVSRKREDRAIAGLSMGGREAIAIGLTNPRKFAWIGGFSSAFPDIEHFRVPALQQDKANFRLIWIACGVADREFVFKGNMRVIADLTQRGMPVTAVVTHGIHDWPVWRSDLHQFLPLLFQPK